MKKTTVFPFAMALAVCAGAAAAAALDPGMFTTLLSSPETALALAAAGGAGVTRSEGGKQKITVTSHAQDNGVDYSEGRHEVDEDVAKRLVANGTAIEGWPDEPAELAKPGTASPNGGNVDTAASGAGTAAGADGDDGGGDDTSTRGTRRSKG